MNLGDFTVGIARRTSLNALFQFSDSLLSEDNDAIYNREFLCKQGLRSAVLKNYVIVASFENTIIGMLRFYPNRRAAQISIYQFAVSTTNRGQGVVTSMLRFLRTNYTGAIVCKCPKSSVFNEYFDKTGWITINEYDAYYQWEWRN